MTAGPTLETAESGIFDPSVNTRNLSVREYRLVDEQQLLGSECFDESLASDL
ncbi:hypothetical protein HSB1_07120 [Halogranum salarium B-1]|uniref:Uncharacterized protein n=1 Tax=Halogranum salarium B-1 TaxID=1210908 RepID=J3JGG6_9EURY|nr:hypothetical protein HSB1_07120 [Halogranum salarium B-1]